MDFLKKLGKKKLSAIIIIALLIIGLVAVLIYRSSSSSKVTYEGSIETVETRTIANSISGTGVVNSTDMEEVTYGSSTSILTSGASVQKVYVEEGDVVGAGDIICQFDTEDLEDSGESLQKQRDRLQEQYDDVSLDKWETRVEQNEQDAKYDEQVTKNQQDRDYNLRVAWGNYSTSVTNYNNAAAEAANAKQAYDDYIAGGGNAWDMQGSYLKSQQTAAETSMSTYSTEAKTYKAEIDTLREEDDQDLLDAKADYDEAVDDTVETYDDTLEDLQESIDDVDEEIADNNQAIADCTVRCTMGGTVTAVNVKEGFSFSGSVVAVIEGVETFLIEAEISEYDIPDVEVGMDVLVKTDATRDQELTGRVTYVAPRATGTGESDSGSLSSLTAGLDLGSMTGSSSSGATFLVRIGDLEQNSRLRLGMNASVSILTNSAADALSIPFDALQTDEEGQYYVELVTSGDDPSDENFATKQVYVTLGLEGSYYVEIEGDGIVEGAKIFVPSSGNGTTLDDLLTNMGSDAGI